VTLCFALGVWIVNASKSPVTAIYLKGSTPPKNATDTGETTTGIRSTPWPPRPEVFPELLTPTEAAQYLRLDELGTHTPQTAIRTLNYWRDRKNLKATKYARHVWYRKSELDSFLKNKTES